MALESTTVTVSIDERLPGQAAPTSRTFPTTIRYLGAGLVKYQLPAGTLSAGYSQELVPVGMNVLSWLVVNPRTGDAYGPGATASLVVAVNGAGGIPVSAGGWAGSGSGEVTDGVEITSITVGITVDQVAEGAYVVHVVGVPA